MKAYAVFIGYQEMFGGEAPQPLFNVEGDHPQRGSTLFEESLVNLGIPLPIIPTYGRWREEKAQ